MTTLFDFQSRVRTDTSRALILDFSQRSLCGFGRDWRAGRRLCHPPEGRSQPVPDRSERTGPERAQGHPRGEILPLCRFGDCGGASDQGIADPLIRSEHLIIYHGAWFSSCSPLFWCFRLPPFAGITDDVARRWRANNFSAAEAELQSYRGQQGVTPDYVEALSWMARASLQSQPTGSRRDLCPPDRESVTAIADQARPGRRTAPADCSGSRSRSPGPGAGCPGRTGPGGRAAPSQPGDLPEYFHPARLQKNLNLLALVGQPAPAAKDRAIPGPQAGDPGRAQAVRPCCSSSGRTGARTARRKGRSLPA